MISATYQEGKMNIFEAIMQGIIQGLTEFLPVSSSGHLSLYQHFTAVFGSSSSWYAGCSVYCIPQNDLGAY